MLGGMSTVDNGGNPQQPMTDDTSQAAPHQRPSAEQAPYTQPQVPDGTRTYPNGPTPGADGQPQYGQPPYGQSPYGQSPYGQPQYAPGYPQQIPYGYVPRQKIVAGLLGIFLGVFGIHNFYLGYTNKAIAQLLLTLLLGWIGIGVLISGIWALVEAILILTSNYGSPRHKDAKGVELQD